MPGFAAARAVSAALTAVATTGLVSLVAVPAASAGPRTGATGTIVYDNAGDIYQTTPDGASTHRVTTDGSTATGDQTGSTGYAVPTESDDGLIAAVRNQDYGSYSQGFIWVMDRNGTVLRKFKPPQFDLLPQFEGCSGPDAQFPTGILNASISPDGEHIAYTATAIGNAPNCEAISEVGSWVSDLDGKHGHWLSAGSGDTADLEIGRWVSDNRVLVDRFDFGSIENYYVDLPSYAATSWSAPPSDDFVDEAYLQPDVANGVVATDGYSEFASAPTIRLWKFNGYSAQPTAECEYSSVAHPNTTNVNLNQPSLSPDGSEVVFEDYDGTAPNAANEGIYLAPAAATLTSTQACNAATSSLFLAGAEDPFWTPASITALPPDTTAPTIALTAPTHAATIGSSVKVSWTGSDDYSGIAYYQVRDRVASYSSGFGSWSLPSQHLTGSAAIETGLARGKDYCFEVRAADNAGNTSSWSSARCTAVPLDDRSLSRSAGWKQATGHAYYAGTITTSSNKGATLTRTHAQVDRIDVVATTCAGCGSVSVDVGSHHVGTISLHSSTTRHQVLKSLPTFSTRSGTVKLTVTTSGKTVAIDGVVLSRT